MVNRIEDSREAMMDNNKDLMQKAQMVRHLIESKKGDSCKIEKYLFIFLKFILILLGLCGGILTISLIFSINNEDVNAYLSEVQEIILILPILIFVIVIFLIFHNSKKKLFYLWGQNPPVVKCTGSYLGSEESQLSAYYKHKFKSNKGYKIFYSKMSFQELREAFSLELRNKWLSEEEEFTEERVVPNRITYILFRLYCFLFPLTKKLKDKLFERSPKKPMRIKVINELYDSVYESFNERQQREEQRIIHEVNRLRQRNRQVHENLIDGLAKPIFKDPSQEEYKINEFLTVKLEGKRTELYVNNEYFQQCKFLLINIPKENINKFNEFDSIDEISENLDRSLELSFSSKQEEYNITPEEEFRGHCSNLQAWYENDYDTRLLHSNLAFPLLKKLTEAGDPLAKKRFKEEIALRLESGYEPVIRYLIEEKYLQYLNDEEISTLLDNTLFLSTITKKIKEAEIIDKYLRLNHQTNHNFIFKNFFLRKISKYTGVSTSLILKILKESYSNSIYDVHYISSPEGFNKVKYMNRKNPNKQHLIIIIDDVIRPDKKKG